MLMDLAGTLLALALWAAFTVAPGLAAARFARLDDGPPVVLPLSFAVSPALAFLLARSAGVTVAAAVFAVAALPALPWVMQALRGIPRWALAAGAAWAVFAYVEMADLVWQGALSLSGLATDYAKHVAVTSAVARTGVPPVNPSFRPGTDVPLFYYYLWFMQAGMVDLLGGKLVAARHAVWAGTIWTGWALIALLAVAARRLAPALPAPPGPAGWAPWAAGLLLITGLDVIPFAAIQLWQRLADLRAAWVPDLEWWNEQVSAWTTAMLWVPHHLAAFIACTLGLLVLRRPRPSAARLLVAALAFASAAGMSVWVAFTAAAIALAWLAVCLVRRRIAEAAGFAAAGLLAVLLAAPFLLDLAAARQETGGLPLAFGIREFFPLTRAEELLGLRVRCGAWCRLAALPLNYFLELGFFALAAVPYWRWRRTRGPLGDDERLLIVMLAVGVLVVSALRADLAANDLGWRGMMFAQFVLLLWAAPALAWVRRGPALPLRWHAALSVALALGLLASITQAMDLRFTAFRADRWDLRRTYKWIGKHLPPTAIVQHDPSVGLEPFHALYGGRQTVVSDALYAGLYGIPRERVLPVMAVVAAPFKGNASPELALATARRFGITHLLAKSGDPAWQNKAGWVWVVEPVFATPTTRVIAVEDLAGR